MTVATPPVVLNELLLNLNRPRRVGEGTPKLILSTKALRKMQFHCHQGVTQLKDECSGLGLIEEVEPGYYYVSDIEVIKPKRLEGMYIEMDPTEIRNYMMKIMSKNPNNMEKFRFMWHTHADSGVSWSGVDEKNAQKVFGSDAEWTMQIVTNSKGHFLARQDFPASRRVQKPMTDLPVFVHLPISRSEKEEWREDFSAKHDEFIQKHRQDPNFAPRSNYRKQTH